MPIYHSKECDSRCQCRFNICNCIWCHCIRDWVNHGRIKDKYTFQATLGSPWTNMEISNNANLVIDSNLWSCPIQNYKSMCRIFSRLILTTTIRCRWSMLIACRGLRNLSLISTITTSFKKTKQYSMQNMSVTLLCPQQRAINRSRFLWTQLFWKKKNRDNVKSAYVWDMIK